MRQSSINCRQLSQIIILLLERGDSPKVVAEKIAAYMVSQGCSDQVDMLVRSLAQVMHSMTGRLEVDVKSRHELTADVRRVIAHLFSDQGRVTLSEKIDPSLLGGARIVANDEVLDVSVRSRINALKQAVKV